MKKQINFNVAIDYQFFSGAPDSEKLAAQLGEVLRAAVNQNYLNTPKVCSAEKVASVAPLVVGYSECEVDVMLCVFDEFTQLLTPSLGDSANELRAAMVNTLEDINSQGGIAAVRLLAMEVGKIIESVWQELTSLGYDEKLEDCFDLDFLPELLATVHANHNEFPTAESSGAWTNAALEVLDVDRDEYDRKKLAHDNPEFSANLRAAANCFRAALDAAGLDKLSKGKGKSAASLLKELDALAEEFRSDQV